MDFRSVGGSGLRVSLAGLGCNNFGGRIDQAATDAVVAAALDAGITLFDTADIYGGTARRSCSASRSVRTATRSSSRRSSRCRWATVRTRRAGRVAT